VVKLRIVIDICKYLVGFGLLGFVVWRNWAPASGNGLVNLWQRQIHWGALALAGGLCAIAVLLTFVRWFLLVRAQDLPFTLGAALRLGLVGYYYNTLLPGSVGGDLVKAAGIARAQDRRTVAVATVIIDRVVGLWALVWLVVILGSGFWAAGLVVGPGQATCRMIILTAGAILGASLVTWFLLGLLPSRRADIFAGRLERIPKIGHSLAEAWRAVWMYRVRGHSIWIALALAVVGHVGFVLTLFFAARALWQPSEMPSIAENFLIIPIGMAVQAGIPTPGGVGGGEIFFGLLYSWIGYPRENGELMTLVYRLVTWVLGFAGYLVYLQMRPELNVEKRDMDFAA
jgi:uncharacterized protein (TIRG00374 family)